MHKPQHENLLADIHKRIRLGRFRISQHSLERQKERNIELPDVIYVLKTGYHEKKKTTFDVRFDCWKYAIRGKTLDEADVRVIVAFDERDMLIITVMHVGDR